MFEYKYSQRELEIAKLRQEGMPYSKIAEKYGVEYQRVQTIYARTLEKLRMTRDIKRNWNTLAYVCEKQGLDNIRLVGLIKVLKRNGITSIRSRRLRNYDECLKIRGIGVKYANLILQARERLDP